MARDDAKALELIQQVVAADPADKSAKAQLADLSVRVAEALAGKLGDAISAKDRQQEASLVTEMERLLPQEVLQKYPVYAMAKNQPSLRQAVQQPAAQSGGDANTKAQSGGDARTKALYARFREANRARQEELAYNLLKEIIAIDPADENACTQSVELGKRLCTAKSAELTKRLREGDVPGLMKLVDCLHSWASNEFLHKMPEFTAADKLVADVRRQEAMSAIEKRLQRLRESTGTPAERESEALSLEELAAQHGIMLEADERAYLTRIHQEHKEYKHDLHCKQRSAEIAQELEVLLPTKADLLRMHSIVIENKLSRLGELTLAVEEMGNHPLALELAERCRKNDKAMRELIAQRIARRKSRLRIQAAIYTLLLAAAGVCYYASHTASQLAKELAVCIEEKNTLRVSEILGNHHPISRLGALFVREYKEMRFDASVWLAGMNELTQEVDSLTLELERLTAGKGVSLEDLSAAVKLYRRWEDVQKRLTVEYNFSRDEKVDARWQEFRASIMAMRGPALSKYSAPPRNSSMDELSKLWEEFRSNFAIFEFTDDEARQVRTAFIALVEDKLMWLSKRDIPTKQEVEQSLQTFSEYRERLELGNDMQLKLKNLLMSVQAYEGINSSLSAASTMSEYLSALKKIESLYNRLPNAYKLEDVLRITTSVRADLGFRHSVAKSKLPIPLNSNTRTLLSRIIDIFKSGGDAYYEYNKNISSRIDAIADEAPKVWSDDFVQLSTDSMVYVGKVSRVNDKYVMHPVDESGNSLKKDVILPVEKCTRKKLKLSNVRDGLGLKRIDLQRSTVPPADLLLRIAASEAPPLARAWLFKQIVLLMKDFSEPLATGIDFSPTLKSDISDFNRLDRKYGVHSGSWLVAHKLEADEAFARFFKRCATHDYSREIVKNLTALTECELKFVGFVGNRGTLLSKAPDGEVLYTISFEGEDPVLVRVVPGVAPLFAPLFTL